MLKNTRFWTTPRGGQGGLGTPWDHWAALGGKKCRKIRGFWPRQGRPRWRRGPLGPMGRTGVAKNAEKHKVFGHPKGGQGGLGTPWDPWAALGWQKIWKNTTFLATPRAAKVAKGPFGAHGPHWGGQKCVKMRGFWPPQGGQGG